jgi:hypothetical protein
MDAPQALFFGIYYQYTQAQDMKLWLDNIHIKGHFTTDPTPPGVQKLTVLNDSSFLLEFTEPVKDGWSLQQVLLNGKENPSELSSIAPSTLLCTFNAPLELENTLFVKNFTDHSGNQMKDTLIRFIHYVPGMYGVVINEIMYAPAPASGLPELEYMELYNLSQYPVAAQNWKLCVNKKCRDFNLEMDGHGYLILCDAKDTAHFSGYGKTAGVKSLYALPNDGALIELLDQNGDLIHYAQYKPGWHANIYKEDGGWSLEMIDAGCPCLEKGNWASSEHPDGGTPGKVNSVAQIKPDFERPNLERVSVADSQRVKLHFSEHMAQEGLFLHMHYFLDDAINPIAVTSGGYGFNTLELEFDEKFKPNRKYTLSVSRWLKDCAGNSIDKDFAMFALPSYPDSLDIVINEVLFEPGPWGTEFIELYNRSDKTIDLDHVHLAILDPFDGTLGSIVKMEAEGLLLFPQEYIALTNNRENLVQQYMPKDASRIFENPLPALNNVQSTLVACNNNFKILDRLDYSVDQHHPFLNSTEGVSLERVNPEVGTANRANWQSAAFTYNYATPGYQNSQYKGEIEIDKTIVVEPTTFSPDNDGYNDVLHICIAPEEDHCLATIWIFDGAGRKVRDLGQQVLLGTENTLLWDGTDDTGQLQRIGIYTLFIRLVSPTGGVKEYKKCCVLARMLD